ncbi:cytochrome bd-I ubiquinol oxidase subunit 2 apoprotein [Arachidicoccus rhizosphaerae]|uniref:Cytochrome bd-I ubiquinol oxidase subunit 2 apoprotein n=1 Tax=Arachidicoccus rhizosphaerae TaxID=551991 RepID=A0A1H4BTR6_9BACT|nr:cytochrome d ubiquinol oxidase subunit II [Arachidicoccus rhizosphaerae]SEA51447.1 cytochrome bd-I ubiquinol oxidase subunit 2 apoprotein [Arachidicoccus rhizosphaerae]
MLYVVITFLWVSLWFYLLFGGADFGAGILELFTRAHNKDRTRRTMYRAIGPIWEANHMWLIIAIVILFVGFPKIYATMSTAMHIPLIIMLLGIIARGTAFAFRHYDAVVDDMQQVYNRIFTWSSLITPLFLGIIAGSTVTGKITQQPKDFLEDYVFSWLNWFCVAVGCFTVAIAAFLAAVFLIGEAQGEKDKRRFIAKAKTANIAAFIAGALVFFASLYQHIPLLDWIFANPVGIISITAASLSLILLWYLLSKGKVKILPVLAGFQVTMILLSVTYIHFPKIVLLKDGGYLSLLEHEATGKTIDALGAALLIGSLFILPALFYLLYSFRKSANRTKA